MICYCRKGGWKMKRYAIELIHESTGAYMNFEYESDLDEDSLSKDILQDISVVVLEVLDDE